MKQKRPNTYIFYGTVSAILSALLFGCGNLYNDGRNDYMSYYGAYGQVSSNPLLGPGGPYEHCPSTSNVTPKTGGFDNPITGLRDFSWYLDDTGYFVSCKNQNNAQSVFIEGDTKFSKTVCVFPALLRKDRPDLGPLFYPSGSGVVHQCQDLKGTGDVSNGFHGFTEVRFSDLQFNYIVVVEHTFERAMETCLYSGDERYCPGSSEDTGYFSAGRVD